MEIITAAMLYLGTHASVPRVDLPKQYYETVPGTTKEYWQTMQQSSLIHTGNRTWILNVDGTMSPYRGF